MNIVRMFFPLWVLIFAPICFSFPGWAAATDKVPCIAGYSVKNVADVDPRDAEAALKVWARELAVQWGFDLKISLYNSTDRLIADFMDKKLDFITVTSIDYLRSPHLLKFKPEVTHYKDGKPTSRYVVLVNEQGLKNSPSGLKNKKLSIQKTNHLGQMFLDNWLMRAKLPPSERFFSLTMEKSKESQAILDVFFGQADVCVVTDKAFHTMTELNPQVGQKLHVIAQSPDLITAVGIFRPDYPPDDKQRAMKGMSNDYRNSERGKQILLLFNVEKMDTFHESQLVSIRQLVTEYDRLKKTR